MKKTLPLLLLAALAASAAFADDKSTSAEKPKTDDKPKTEAKANAGEKAKAEDKQMSGISILGNQDSPKSLVIVPWKSSQLADMPTVSRLLDSATQPVDKDVFMRELSYYEFKSGSK